MKAPSGTSALFGLAVYIVMSVFGCCMQQPTSQLLDIKIGDPDAKPPKYVELKKGLDGESALRVALARIKAHGGICQIWFCRHDGQDPDRNYCENIPVRLKTDRIIKSAGANNAAVDSSAANDPNVTYRIASSNPSDITGVLDLLKTQ